MKTTLAERLKLARTRKGLSQKALGEIVGVSQAAIQKIEVGKAKETMRLLELARALGVRPDWLATGQDPMEDEIDLDALLEARHPKSEIVPTRLKIGVWEEMDNHNMDEFVEIPLINVKFSAGPDTCEIIEDDSFSLIFRRYSLHKMGIPANNARLVRVYGDSMSPAISDGDVVGINLAETEIRDGRTYAICHDDMLRVKTLTTQPGKIIIRSINRDEYPDEVLDRPDFLSSVKIIGKVFWSAHMW